MHGMNSALLYIYALVNLGKMAKGYYV